MPTLTKALCQWQLLLADGFRVRTRVPGVRFPLRLTLWQTDPTYRISLYERADVHYFQYFCALALIWDFFFLSSGNHNVLFRDQALTRGNTVYRNISYGQPCAVSDIQYCTIIECLLWYSSHRWFCVINVCSASEKNVKHTENIKVGHTMENMRWKCFFIIPVLMIKQLRQRKSLLLVFCQSRPSRLLIVCVHAYVKECESVLIMWIRFSLIWVVTIVRL